MSFDFGSIFAGRASKNECAVFPVRKESLQLLRFETVMPWSDHARIS
jgi:hypothetical protein